MGYPRNDFILRYKNSTKLTPRVFPCTLFPNHGYLLNVCPTKVFYKMWGVNHPDGTPNLVPSDKLQDLVNYITPGGYINGMVLEQRK